MRLRFTRIVAAFAALALLASIAHTQSSMPRPLDVYTASRALVSGTDGLPAASATTSAQIGFLSTLTSAAQAQIDAKLPLAGGAMTGPITYNSATAPVSTDYAVGKGSLTSGALALNAPTAHSIDFQIAGSSVASMSATGIRSPLLTASRVVTLDSNKDLAVSVVTPTELAYLSGANGVKVRLTADRTYYVSTTGNNGNDCLTVGTPCLTANQAILDAQRDVDTGAGFNVIVQLADGTYTGAVQMSGPLTGPGRLVLTGNTGTPANVILSVTSGDVVTAALGARMRITGMELRSTTSGNCLRSYTYAVVGVSSSVRFGACASAHMQADAFGSIELESNYTISGASPSHYSSINQGRISGASLTVTVSGTPAFSSAFAAASVLSTIYLPAMTYSGSATGVRYSAGTNAVIFTNGGGASYFPGSSAGTTGTGGIYN